MSSGAIRPNRYISQRRSQRVLLSISILAKGKRADGHPFTEQTRTVVVNAHGALLSLAENVGTGQILTIFNMNSGEEVPCRVVDIGASETDKREVAIEFLEPSERFWRVSFPPGDWSLHSPEAKRVSNEAISFAKQKSTTTNFLKK